MVERAMMRAIPLLLLATTLSACATDAPGVAPAPAPPPAYTSVGLERVIGQNAAALARLFGDANADVREGTARKLQYAGAICVLDLYLYPKGAGEPLVSYIDAREPDGSAIDRASCVSALALGHAGR